MFVCGDPPYLPSRCLAETGAEPTATRWTLMPKLPRSSWGSENNWKRLRVSFRKHNCSRAWWLMLMKSLRFACSLVGWSQKYNIIQQVLFTKKNKSTKQCLARRSYIRTGWMHLLGAKMQRFPNTSHPESSTNIHRGTVLQGHLFGLISLKCAAHGYKRQILHKAWNFREGAFSKGS